MTTEDKRRDSIEHLSELIAEIPVVMLTTCLADHSLRSRPMVNVNNNFQGDLWFFTNINDPKVEEIRGNPQVNVALAAPGDKQYVSISGTASTTQDQKRIELLWDDECDRWFPEGPKDDQLALIQVEIERAEYWDAKQNAMVALTGWAKGMTGKSKDSVKHDKIDWDPEPGPPGRSEAN